MTDTGRSNVITAFTEEQVERITGISKSQLRFWDRTRFFEPSFVAENRRVPFSRFYSFRDMLNLQVLNSLRNDIGVSLQHLREVKEKLSHLGDDVWSKTILYVVKKKVVFQDPKTQTPVEVVSGQHILQIPLERVRSATTEAVVRMADRDPEQVGKLEQNRFVSHNRVVFAGTRIPVDSVREFIEAGYSDQQILAGYPRLKIEDIRKAREIAQAA